MRTYTIETSHTFEKMRRSTIATFPGTDSPPLVMGVIFHNSQIKATQENVDSLRAITNELERILHRIEIGTPESSNPPPPGEQFL